MPDIEAKHGWARITQELYDNLLSAYRSTPGIHANAARRALCRRETAKRGYELGWPRLGFRPIRDVLADERDQAAARARDAALRAAEAAEADRDKAKAEAIDAALQEKQTLKAARGDVLAALVIAAELVPAMRNVAKAVAEHCKPKADGSPPDIPPAVAMGLLTRHATLIQKAVGAAEVVVQLSRLDRGASTVNVGLTAVEDLPIEQAIEELEALEETLALARSARGLPAKSGT